MTDREVRATLTGIIPLGNNLYQLTIIEGNHVIIRSSTFGPFEDLCNLIMNHPILRIEALDGKLRIPGTLSLNAVGDVQNFTLNLSKLPADYNDILILKVLSS